jgi:hypothetical protein
MSSTAQESRHECSHVLRNGVHVLSGVDAADSAWFACRQPEKSRAHGSMKACRFPIDPVLLTAMPATPSQTRRYRKIKKQGEIGLKAAGREPVGPSEIRKVQTPAVSLICQRGIGKTVAENDRP